MFFDEFIGKLIPANFSFKTFTKTDITNEFEAKIDNHFSNDPDKHIVVPVIKSTSARLEFEDQYVYDMGKRVEGEHKDFIKQHSHHVMSKLSLSEKAFNKAIPPKPICFLNEDLIEKKCTNCPFCRMKNFYSIKLKSKSKEIINKTDVDRMNDIKTNEKGEIDKFIENIKKKSKISFPLQIPSDFNKFFWGDDELIEYLISISFYMHDWTKVVYFPSLFHTINIKDKCPQRESGLFYQTNKKDDSNAHCRFLYNQFFMFTNILSLWATHDNTLRHSAKAAVTAIMSRNLSHNIGSHVLSYWNQELENKLNIQGTYDENQTVIKKSKVLLQYIQQRMDFLAEISTSIPCSELALDIKNDILGPFVNPNRDKYHTTEVSNDISVLLRYIAESEGINLHGRIKIKLNGLKSNRVSIPNGVVGTHAIYSILENFIRNAAKYYRGSVNNAVNFIIVVQEPKYLDWDKKYVAISIWDMRDNSCNNKDLKKMRSFLPKWKNGNGTKHLKGSENNTQNCEFTNTEGTLLPGGWGMKEMLTCANFLRKSSPEVLYEILSEGYNPGEPPLLDILCGEEPEGKSCCTASANNCSHKESEYKNKLGIGFYLRKPKDLAVAIEKTNIDPKNTFGIEEIKNLPKKKDNNTSPLKEEIPHKILLLDKDYEENYKDDPKSPCRIRLGNTNDTINDDYYLKSYKEFIDDDIIKNEDWPQMIFTGGGESNKYKPLFEKRENNYGKAVNEDILVNGEFHSTVGDKGFLLFYHHAENAIYITKAFLSEKRKDGMKYFQGMSASHSFYTRVTNPPSDKKINQHFQMEIIESAMTRVVIVDERVSRWANKDYKTGIKIKDVLEYMNVYVIPVCLSKITLSEMENNLTKIGNEKFSIINSDAGIHFFVIHQGVLDKMEKEGKDNSINLLGKVKCRWKVVASGRGVPPELKEYNNVRFIEISALLIMLENYDKHALVQTLFSLRNP